MAKKKITSSKLYSKKGPNTRTNELMIIVLCVIFVIIGVFFVYRSFAAAVLP